MNHFQRTAEEWMQIRRERPAYGEWRTLVEELGGTMSHDKSNHDWVIIFGGNSIRIATEGHHYPSLDLCYEITPERSPDQNSWDYYHGPFRVDCAIGKLQEWFPDIAKKVLLFT